MAQQQVIFIDGDELNLLLKTNTGRESNLFSPDDVRRVSFSYYTDKKLFGLIKKPMRRITLICKGFPTIEFDEGRNSEFFEQYLTDLRAYCKRTHVTFYDFPDQA